MSTKVIGKPESSWDWFLGPICKSHWILNSGRHGTNFVGSSWLSKNSNRKIQTSTNPFLLVFLVKLVLAYFSCSWMIMADWD